MDGLWSSVNVAGYSLQNMLTMPTSNRNDAYESQPRLRYLLSTDLLVCLQKLGLDITVSELRGALTLALGKFEPLHGELNHR